MPSKAKKDADKLQGIWIGSVVEMFGKPPITDRKEDQLAVKVQVLVSPFTSVTVKVTVMLPAPETLVPTVGDCVTLCTPQLSPVVAKLV